MNTGLKGKAVLITGASQGMGRATAEAFAAEGARVAICARKTETIKAAGEEIKAKHKIDVIAEVVDVTNLPALRAFAARVEKEFGAIDVCVANAGGPPSKQFAQTTIEDWRHAFELNFLNVVALAHAVIPCMQRRKWGRFVAITSTSVRQPIPDIVLSSCIRPAVVGLVKSLAIEFGPHNITFNNVAPGWTATERLGELAMSRAQAAGIGKEQIYERWASEVPMRRLGKPEEVADAIVWLASERAGYITGQTLIVDGGVYKGI
jgi:3-oxoacyl-[acyl-carrier protein] reductase